ncbi:glycoside hydrolase family 15 protein [Paenibacillus hexagrammi]|uniref:Glycoside hydrolase family 15 protein n=1 Tax=Paenibacillus hexagrammi TaxID=2908839 RepID=A0ABY3SN18_9BACL|nr:glycoside hydrolase family 15 protein [Paenibacillus sp. YPD9-1]UJF34486.1 glycoside hydrolase family 15 protein [Paenibacillus sp. YPD9-1]
MSQDKKPYLIDAIAGNSRFLASLGRTGRMFRLWWPHIDYPQHVDEIRTGLFVDGLTERTSWFDSAEEGWGHEAGYVSRTNIFRVLAEHATIPVSVQSLDYAVPGQNVFVRHYSFTNRSDSPVSFRFMYYSSFRSMETNYYHTTQFDEALDAITHMRHEYIFSVSSSNVCTGFQAGQAWAGANTGQLNGTDIDMQPDGALSWSFTSVQPGQTVEVPVYIAAGSTRQEAAEALALAKSQPAAYWYDQTAAYWQQYLADAVPAPEAAEDIRELYERSLLTMKLMSDEQSGSVVAAPEFDEGFTRCGGYAYCWGRDAAFITTALDRVGLSDLSTRFYEWTLTAQDADGSWQQRHYHDGRLAPSWGLQIDEGASILWGMWQHYSHIQDAAFAERVWPAVAKGADFLVSYIDEETGLPAPSRDLWEERLAEHTYSAAAVYGGLTAAAAFARLRGLEEQASAWALAAEGIQQRIGDSCWNEDRGSFYRGLKLAVTEPEFRSAEEQGAATSVKVSAKGYPTYLLQHDPVIDISLLGISVPFGAVDVHDPRMARTAEAIERELTVPVVGGIKRYEDDPYIGGNPWILTTLWLSHYKIAVGQYEEARALLQWAVDHRTDMGLLPEQIDKVTGETAWVVPLTWSHAMFILAVSMLSEVDQLRVRQLQQ